MTHHGCKLSVEGLCVVVRLVEVSISPLDEVPGLDPKVLGAGVDSLHFAVGEVCRMNVRFRGVTDVESPVEATRTLVFPQDTSPSLTAVLGRFSILSVAESLQDKVDATGRLWDRKLIRPPKRGQIKFPTALESSCYRRVPL